MPETDVTATDLTAEYKTALTLFAFADVDVANGNRIRPSGNDLIVFRNTGVSQRTVTVTSSADSHNRSGSIAAETLDAGAQKGYRIKNADGWLTGGYYIFSGNHADVEVAVIRL